MKKKASIFKGMKQVSPLIFSVIFFGMIFGFTGASGGFPLYFVSSMSVIIFAGSAQFITLILIIQEEAIIAIIIAAGVINLRHLIYGSVLHDKLTFSGLKKLIPAYFLTDEAFLVTTLVDKEMKMDESDEYILDYVLIGSGIMLWVFWNLATIAGFLLYSLSDTLIDLPENFVISASFVGFLIEHFVNFPEDRLIIGFTSTLSVGLGFILNISILIVVIMIFGALFAIIRRYFRYMRNEK